MNHASQTKSSQQMVEAIFALNLDRIKQKLMDKTNGYGWTRRQADHNEREYKRFLMLLAKYPDQSIVPTTEVNKFWHGHILDTMKYVEDCETVFGYFVHHCPYLGTQGEEDAANLVSAFMRMQQLYEREFGDASETADSYEAVPLFAATAHKIAWGAARSGRARQTVDQDAARFAATRADQGLSVSTAASRLSQTGTERAF